MKENILRSDVINYLENVYGIPVPDSEYTFFHDETENIRKLIVNAGGRFNREEIHEGTNLFCLGGVASKRPDDIKLTPFLTNLKEKKEYDSTVDEELKFNKLFPSKKFKDICSILKSEKLTFLLRYILDNEILVHFFCSDYFFMLTGDIVFKVEGEDCDRESSFAVKDALYRFIKTNQNKVLKILHFHKYDFEGEVNINFYMCLKKYYIKNKNSVSKDDQKELDSFFKFFGESFDEEQKNNSCKENGKCYAVKDLSHIFLHRILMFNKNIFDKESLIENILENKFNIDGGDGEFHYEFVDSKKSHGIQLSDVVIKLICLFLNFICSKDINDLLRIFDNLTEAQRGNLILLSKIFMKSKETFPYVFRNNLNLSESDIQKISVATACMNNLSLPDQERKDANLIAFTKIVFLE